MENKEIISILLLIIGLVGLAYSAYLVGVYTASQTVFGGMAEMMRRMMGSSTTNYSVPAYIWILPYLFIGVLAMGIVGLLYGNVIVLNSSTQRKQLQHTRSGDTITSSDLEDILKVLKPDERKVVELLLEHGGKMLQRDIRWEAGFSRLKTHRVISRLIERGIVKKIPIGNTNQIILEDWLIKKIK